MKDYHFESHSDKPHYYVFTKPQDALPHQSDFAFYRYDTIEEAMALFQYLRIENAHQQISLGIQKDGARRAAIIEFNGVTVLSDDFKRTSPWKDDPDIMTAAKEASERLGAAWKIDRELVGVPVLIPNESETASYVPWYLEGRVLCPEEPGNTKTSILEVNIEGSGWLSLESVREMAKSRRYDNPKMPMVNEYLVAYQVERNGFGGSMAISPGEFKMMEQQYLMQRQEKAQSVGGQSQSLDSLKQTAWKRTQERNERHYAGRTSQEVGHSL